MDSASAIIAEGIWKWYRLGVGAHRYKTLRESVAGKAARSLRLGRRGDPTPGSTAKSEIWALKDVSLDVSTGDVVGIIGRNGAGKTTILKVISRITRPTRGRATVRGRVGSLLEVGTGFHPELTGRENVFLSGSILGMRRSDIKSRFDEIVEFADISDFLDTPIKRYSSGMKVRLAFAVAAHLEPEILIVDEVLAVGDLAFQKKCLGKMGQVTEEGRTVLFVSHNMAIIQGLCRRGIFLENGAVVADGPIEDAVRSYLGRLEQAGSTGLLDRRDRRGWQEVIVSRVEITQEGSPVIVTGRPTRFCFGVTGVIPRMSCIFTIYNLYGQPVTTLSSAVAANDDRHDGGNEAVFECFIDELLLVPGRYRVDVTLRGRGHRQDILEAASFFDVEQGVVRGRPVVGDEGFGSVALPHRWRIPERGL
jgi:lipopolysaccharide transport system ATP-binding protein